MGSFKYICSLSHAPLYNSNCIFILTEKHSNSPISLPIRGIIDDYGQFTATNKSEKDILTKIVYKHSNTLLACSKPTIDNILSIFELLQNECSPWHKDRNIEIVLLHADVFDNTIKKVCTGTQYIKKYSECILNTMNVYNLYTLNTFLSRLVDTYKYRKYDIKKINADLIECICKEYPDASLQLYDFLLLMWITTTYNIILYPSISCAEHEDPLYAYNIIHKEAMKYRMNSEYSTPIKINKHMCMKGIDAIHKAAEYTIKK